ncbi:hypothetical protein [Methanosarcina sp. KYL-1]|uniref:hypothetical protein n=1 Tax=Methanosarcina sp. KYL-1 TaxID=2602068 RepID=UPI002101B385|nr:hypothetical protein [Methanosarcina sp. KYL-1]
MSPEEEDIFQGRSHYPRPGPGEKIPVQVVDFRRLFAAWSPELKKTLYFEQAPPEEEEGLKRVREIILLRVYDWLADRKGIIELTGEEFERFMEVYEEFLRDLGEIQYSRQKHGRRTENVFELRESPYIVREVRNGFFSDKL